MEKKEDLISRQAAIDAFEAHWDTIKEYHQTLDDATAMYVDHKIIIKNLPSAQPERLTDDDFETIRIHLNAYKEKLGNQQRWKEAEEYQRIIDRFMAFASAQQWIPCSERLPEKSDDYLCTYGSLSGWFVDISIYETEKKEFGFYSENEHGEDVWYPVTNVVAWMELPKPWKEGQP